MLGKPVITLGKDSQTNSLRPGIGHEFDIQFLPSLASF